MILGEIAPLVMGFLLGILFGTKLQGRWDPKTVALIVVFGILGSFLFQAPPFFASPWGGVFNGISFSTPFMGAVLGLLLGRAIKGEGKQ